jgi:TolB protein
MSEMSTKLTLRLGAVGVGAIVSLAAVSALASSPAAESRGAADAARASSKIAYLRGSNGNSEIYVMNVDGSGQRRLTRNTARRGSDSSAAWSPDGRRIAFVRGRRHSGSEIYVVNADGSGQRRLTRNGAGDDFPAWSPDGRKIAFQSYRDGRGKIYLMNADGSGQWRLTRNPSSSPAWSPGGRKIAFVSRRDRNSEIYVMNADGSGVRTLTRNATNDAFPAWSPDGRKIAFSRWTPSGDNGGISGGDDNDGIYVMNADGSGQRRLTRRGFEPRWSPDGRRIAFTSESEVYIMNADGSRQQKLADGFPPGAADIFPAWSPDGRKLAFTKSLGGWERGSFEIFVVSVDGSGERRLTRRPGHDFDPIWSPARTS